MIAAAGGGGGLPETIDVAGKWLDHFAEKWGTEVLLLLILGLVAFVIVRVYGKRKP